MRVLVLGNGRKSLQLAHIISAWKEYTLEGVVDYQNNNWEKSENIEGKLIKIVSPMKAIEMYQDLSIDAFIMPSLEEDVNNRMYRFLVVNDVSECDILYGQESLFHKVELKQEGLITQYISRDELDTMEIHVADHCNMNCKNCSMFCGLVKEPKYADFMQTQNSLYILKGIFKHIKRIRVIGGEPLLNKELDKYLYMIRDIYPYSDIRVITNGILVTGMEDNLITAFKETSSKLVVTSYLPLIKKIDKINNFLKNKEINYEISDTITDFQKIYDYTGQQDEKLSFNACHWKGACATLYENQIAPCFVPFVIKYLAKSFDLNISPSGTMLLNADNVDKDKIRKLFNTPFDMCKYCAPRGITSKWEMCDKNSVNNIFDWSI